MPIHSHGTGATVLELMVTLSIAAILLSLAAPSYESFTNRQRMKAALGALHADLMAARSQAIYRNRIVVACPGNPADGCTSGSNWSKGWIVYEDGNGDRQRQEDEHLLRHESRLLQFLGGRRTGLVFNVQRPRGITQKLDL